MLLSWHIFHRLLETQTTETQTEANKRVPSGKKKTKRLRKVKKAKKPSREKRKESSVAEYIDKAEEILAIDKTRENLGIVTSASLRIGFWTLISCYIMDFRL